MYVRKWCVPEAVILYSVAGLRVGTGEWGKFSLSRGQKEQRATHTSGGTVRRQSEQQRRGPGGTGSAQGIRSRPYLGARQGRWFILPSPE